MPEETQTSTPETGAAGTQTEAPATTEQSPTSTEKDWKAEAEKWQAMSRETEKKAAANAKRIKEIEDRDLSELQLAQKQAAETAAALAELQRRNALLSKGISDDLTPPAPNAPADEWSAYADRLLAWRSAAPPVKPELRPDPSQGPRGGGTANPAQQFAEIIRNGTTAR